MPKSSRFSKTFGYVLHSFYGLRKTRARIVPREAAMRGSRFQYRSVGPPALRGRRYHRQVGRRAAGSRHRCCTFSPQNSLLIDEPTAGFRTGCGHVSGRMGGARFDGAWEAAGRRRDRMT